MKAIVTGGAGFIGSHIAEKLLKDGHDVVVMDDLSAGKMENIPDKAKFCQVDISTWDEMAACEEYFHECDVIFHNAASKKNICLRDPVRDLHVNGGGTLMLLQLAKKYRVKKFVHASTGSVYGEVRNYHITEDTYLFPVSYYGLSKLTGENYVRYYNHAFSINTTILRYFHVYGTRQEDDPALGGVVSIFKKQIQEGKPITIHGNGRQQRVFTHVDDIVEANIQSWKQLKAYGQVYNCASSKQITINELADMLMDKYGKVERKYADSLPGDIFHFDVDNDKIKHLGIQFKPFSKDLI